MNLPLPNVLTLSEAATARVRALLADAPTPTTGLKVSIEKSGCAGMAYKMALAEPAPGDEVIEQDGARVIVDGKAVLFLIGTRMDVKAERFSTSFVFENPNQTSACGCGESVALKPVESLSTVNGA